MIHFLSTRLDERGVLSAEDIRAGAAKCETNTGVRLPPGYFPKWLLGRVRLVVETVELRHGQVPLTLAVLERILIAPDEAV
jgi:hypothetical protein